MKESVVSISNQQEAKRAVVALRVVAKQVIDPCAKLSADLIELTQQVLFTKSLSLEAQTELLEKMKVVIEELSTSFASSRRANFHKAIADDLKGIAKTCSSKNMTTAVSLLNCAITNAFSVYNIESVIGNIKPNHRNPLDHHYSETQIIELNSAMKLIQ